MNQGRAIIDVLLLAAGLSRRMGADNKLVLPIDAMPMVRKVAEELIAADIGPVTVVTGYQADAIRDALEGLDLLICYNSDFESGQMSSVRRGCQQISKRPGSVGAMISLADMPTLTRDDYRTMVEAFLDAGSEKIAVPFFEGKQGNPIILPTRLVSDIAAGESHEGCRKLIADRPDDVFWVDVASAGFVRDIDTLRDYAQTLTPD